MKFSLYLLGVVLLLSLTATVASEEAAADPDVEVDEALEVEDVADGKPDPEEDDEVYKVVATNFMKLSDSARNNMLKSVLDDYFKVDVVDKIKEVFTPAFDAVHRATSDNFEGDMSTLKKIKAELNKFAARDGDSARLITNLYRMAVTKDKSH